MNWVALWASSEKSTPRWLASTPIGIAVDGGPSGDQAGAVQGLELVEPGAVDHPGQDLAGVERDLGVGRRDAQELVRVVDRVVGRLARPRSVLAPVEPAHDLAPEPDGVDLVGGQVVGQARHPGVHRGAAQLLVGRTPHRWPSSPVAVRRGRPWSAARSSRCSRSCRERRRRRPWSCRRRGPRWAGRRPSCG